MRRRADASAAPQIPEAVGLAPGAAFMAAAILTQSLWAHFAEGALPGSAFAPAHAGLGCISTALLLGFVDDVLDVPWRVKLVMPALAAAPLLITYTGSTGVVVPLPLRALVGGAAFLELGVLYKLYMLAVAVFCTNSINILAGVNGLEAGQTLVLALACAGHNLARLGAGPETQAAHALSLAIVAPLAAVSAALLCFNWCAVHKLGMPHITALSLNRHPVLQVPRASVCGRHVYAVCGNGACRGGASWVV